VSLRLRRVGAVAIVALALVGGACAGDSQKEAQPTPKTEQRSQATSVTIETFAFAPKRLQVHVGDKVQWTNKDNILHTVTAGTREYDPSDSGHVVTTNKTGAFDMPLDGKGATASFTFAEAGTFHYFCDRHPGMEADVEVS
jgi:plastocyanin